MKKILATILLTTALSACSSLNQSVPTSVLDPTIAHNKQANVQVGRRVIASAKGTVLFGFINLTAERRFADGVDFGKTSTSIFDFKPNMARNLKSAAAYKAVKADNADVLLSPIYEIQTDNFFLWQNYKVSVKAFTGRITGIR